MWQAVPADGSVDPSPVVAAALSTTTVGHFIVHSKAVDAAGNADEEVTAEWWVDTSPPQTPTLAVVPAGVTTSTTAGFGFQLSGDASPGQVSFAYNLTENGTPFTVSGGNPGSLQCRCRN